MPSSDYAMFKAYARIEPFGVRRDDWHHARTQALIANCFNSFMYANGMTKSRKTTKASDFTMPRKKTKTQKLRMLRNTLATMVKNK